MIKVYTNQPLTLKAKLDDPEPADLVELKSLDIINDDGDMVKSINAEKDDDEWFTTFVFPKTAEPGKYEARWTFSFNGEPFYKVDYLDVTNKIEINTDIIPDVKEVIETTSDDTLPQDVKDMMGDRDDI